MYCSSCGTAVAIGLSYCNQCGAKLRGDQGLAKSSEVRPEMLVAAITFVFVGGLGAIVGLMAVLKSVFNQPGDVGLVIFFSLISFLIMLAVEGVFIRMLWGRKKGAEEARDTERLEEPRAQAVDEAKLRALPEPASSITERTTRSLEAVDLKRETE